MTPRRFVPNRRAAPVALLALGASSLWLLSEPAAGPATPPVTACGASPCVVEGADRVEPARAPAPERSRAPSAPSLDWRSLLPAGFLRPR